MPTCIKGHISVADDYCDACGRPIPGVAVSAHGMDAAPGADDSAGTEPGTEHCPTPGCETARVGRFCEACGHDFEERGTWGTEPGEGM